MFVVFFLRIYLTKNLITEFTCSAANSCCRCTLSTSLGNNENNTIATAEREKKQNKSKSNSNTKKLNDRKSLEPQTIISKDQRMSSTSVLPLATANAPVVDEAPPKNLPANTFEMRPNPRNAFKTARVKEIVNDVLNQVLQGKNLTWCFIVRLSRDPTSRLSIDHTSTGKSYAASNVQGWVCSIADDISARCKDLEMRRYRHVVQVQLQQQNGAGSKYIARCRWDAECDSQVSSYFSNETIVCVVSVFGVYFY